LGKPPRVAGKIRHTPCLLSNLELDYESMEKAEIKFIDDFRLLIADWRLKLKSQIESTNWGLIMKEIPLDLEEIDDFRLPIGD